MHENARHTYLFLFVNFDMCSGIGLFTATSPKAPDRHVLVGLRRSHSASPARVIHGSNELSGNNPLLQACNVPCSATGRVPVFICALRSGLSLPTHTRFTVYEVVDLAIGSVCTDVTRIQSACAI